MIGDDFKSAETRDIGDDVVTRSLPDRMEVSSIADQKKLIERLEGQGVSVNALPKRSSVLQHLSDVQNQRCLVGGDSLPVHLALGTRTPCVSIVTCTSPPGRFTIMAFRRRSSSPLLEEFFYKRGYDERATTAVSVDEVECAVGMQLEASFANHAAVK